MSSNIIGEPRRGKKQALDVASRRSDPDEGLHQAAEETFQTKLALHCDETETLPFGANRYLVIDIWIAEIEIAYAITGAIVAETSR